MDRKLIFERGTALGVFVLGLVLLALDLNGQGLVLVSVLLLGLSLALRRLPAAGADQDTARSARYPDGEVAG